jgi:DNA mismatch repair protein MutH
MQKDLNCIVEDLVNKLTKYYGLSFENLATELGLNVHLIKGKLSTVTVINQMLRDAGISKQTLSKQGLNLAIKTVNLKQNGIPKESMSFEQINFNMVNQESWEESSIRNKFLYTTFCFFVLQEIDGQVYFRGIRAWKMPAAQIEQEVKRFWRQLKEVLKNGVVIEKRKRGSKFVSVNNLPSSSDNAIMHVRPKAKDSNDTVQLPCGKLITKQAYWINASFIAGILEDMPQVEKKQTNQLHIISSDINWAEILNADIYTIDEIVNKGKNVVPGFTELKINEDDLSKSGYRIESSYVIREGLGGLDKYLQTKILSNNYFDSKSESIFDTPYVKRKIENYENAYKLLKVEKSLYLTDTGMKKANVGSEEIKSYKNDVENFVSAEIFFTLESIKAEGFKHEIDEYGFDPIFYENLLKRPGRLKNITLDSKTFFVKSVKKVTLTDLVGIILRDFKNLTVNQLLEEIKERYKVQLSFEGVESALYSMNDYYYVPEMNRLFVSKQAYFDFLD